MNATEIIQNNANAVNNSFIFYLHEKNEFNLSAFKLLIYDIRMIANGSNEYSVENYNITIRSLFKIYCYSINRFIYHKIDSNLSKISNYEDIMVYIYLPRLEYLIDCMMSMDFAAVENYEDELGGLDNW